MATEPTSDDGGRGMAFTTGEYAALLDELRDAGREFVGFEGAPAAGEVVLRHDVDLSTDRALAMARVEAARGVSATYFFLVTTPLYDLATTESRRALREMRELGHDVGLHFDLHHHFETPASAVSDAEVRARVAAERGTLERLSDGPVEAVSFHVPPDWVLGATFDGFVNAYAPRFFSDVAYVSDSNQKWRDERPFPDGVPETAQVLVHPGLWHDRDREMADIVAAYAGRAHESVDSYAALLGP